MIQNNLASALNSTILSARTQLQPRLEIILNQGRHKLSPPSTEPILFSGYHTFEERDFDDLDNKVYADNVKLFLRGKAKSQIAYNLLRIITNTDEEWNDNIPLGYEKNQTYEEIRDSGAFTLNFDYRLLIPALIEIEKPCTNRNRKVIPGFIKL
jgi:hypothetical protein